MKSTIIKLTFLILALGFSIIAQDTKNNQKKSPIQTKILFHNLSNEAVPLFVFTYISPWRNIYGSDSPEFVLYQDGTVIFTKCEEKDNPYSCYYVMAKLSSEEISGIVEKLHSQEFYSFDNHYSPDTSKFAVTDLTYRLFVMRKPDGTYKFVSTYGTLSGDKTGYVAENVPVALKEIVKFVTSYDNANPIELGFEYYEVVIEPYSDDSKKNLKWSKDLPNLNDSKTTKHKKYGRYSLFVPNNLFYKVKQIQYKQLKSKNSFYPAVLINNQRWEIEARIPFPSEAVWLGNFRDEK
jgi:hypothetical protein